MNAQDVARMVLDRLGDLASNYDIGENAMDYLESIRRELRPIAWPDEDGMVERECEDCGGLGYRDEWGDPPVPCMTCQGSGLVDDDEIEDDEEDEE